MTFASSCELNGWLPFAEPSVGPCVSGRIKLVIGNCFWAPRVLSAARGRENWFWVSPSMVRH